MKRTLKKVLVIFLVFLMLLNYSISSLAVEEPIIGSMGSGTTLNNTFKTVYNLLINILGAFIGLATWGLRAFVVALCAGAQVIISGIATLGGIDTSSSNPTLLVTPMTIFFNNIPLLDVDFMNFNSTDATPTVIKFREQVATWYYVIRLIATAILLLILIYIGIRMALSTMAQDKAIYNKMLTDWACSLALLYLLHYLIVFVVNLNNILVEMVESMMDGSTGLTNFSTYITSILLQSVSASSGFTGIVSTILYALIVWQTLKFLLVYMRRMITIGFLIIISPLITITYSIDKIGDQKAQALNTWLKEFAYNILIQPFHCIMYLAFADVAIRLIEPSVLDTMFNVVSFIPGLTVAVTAAQAVTNTATGTNTLAAGILAVVCLSFIDDGEKIIRKIFGFSNASSLADVAAQGAMIATMANKAGEIGKKVAKTGMVNKNMFRQTGNLLKTDAAVLKNLANKNGKPNGLLNKLGNGMEKVGNTMADGHPIKAAKEKVGGVAGKIGNAAMNTGIGKSIQKNFKTNKEKSTITGKNYKKARDSYASQRAPEIARNNGKDWNKLSETEKSTYTNEARKEFRSTHKFAALKSGGAVGTVLRAGGNVGKKTISRAKTGISTAFHDKDFIATGIGITAGLAMYSSTSNKALESIITGMGAREAVAGALSSTKGSVATNISESMQVTENVTGKKFESEEDRRKYLDGVKLQGDAGGFETKAIESKFNGLIEELKRILKSEQDAFAAAAMLQRTAQTTPDFKLDTALKDVLSNFQVNGKQVEYDKLDIGDRANVAGKAKDYLTTTARAKDYSGIQTAATVGLTTAALATMVSSITAKSSTRTEKNVITEETHTIETTEELGASIASIEAQLKSAATKTEQDFKDAMRNIEADMDRVNNASEDHLSTDYQREKIENLKNEIEKLKRDRQTH